MALTLVWVDDGQLAILALGLFSAMSWLSMVMFVGGSLTSEQQQKVNVRKTFKTSARKLFAMMAMFASTD